MITLIPASGTPLPAFMDLPRDGVVDLSSQIAAQRWLAIIPPSEPAGRGTSQVDHFRVLRLSYGFGS